jgi:hypothetical protein
MRLLAATTVAGLALAVVAVAVSPARADDPFSLTATGGGTTITASSNNVIDLATDLIKTQDEFAALSGRSSTATLRYGGLDNAVLVTRNAAGTSATITIPSTGFTRTFTASNEDALKDQIEDFFKDQGANEYAKFLRSINEQTTLGVVDGNPLSATALMADASFYRFGFQSPRFDIGEGPRLPAGFQVDLAGGTAESDDADGWYARAGIGNTFRFGDRVGLSLNLDYRYRDVEGAAVHQLVNTNALPIGIILPGDTGGLSWTVAPAFVIGVGGSWDLAAGGFPIGGQITSSLAYRAGGWTFVLANQYGFYQGLGITLSDWDFETDVDQQILKNGVQVIRTLGRDGRGFVDAGVAYTNFLNDASTDGYRSPDVGIGFRFGSGSGVRVGYHGDFADNFTTHGGDVTLFITF